MRLLFFTPGYFGLKSKATLLLALMCLFCFFLSFSRVYFTGEFRFLFLGWNLFLAFIPWMFTTLLLTTEKLRKKAWLVFPIMLVWLLFYPNAPYILTDMFHLKASRNAPVWYDTILLLSYAWTGLFFGMVSLFQMEEILRSFVGKKIIPIISMSLLFLSAFGIYVGRFLRWNSWDILNQPTALMGDIGIRVVHPISYSKTWIITILMGIFLNMIYWSIKLMASQKTIPNQPSAA